MKLSCWLLSVLEGTVEAWKLPLGEWSRYVNVKGKESGCVHMEASP